MAVFVTTTVELLLDTDIHQQVVNLEDLVVAVKVVLLEVLLPHSQLFHQQLASLTLVEVAVDQVEVVTPLDKLEEKVSSSLDINQVNVIFLNDIQFIS